MTTCTTDSRLIDRALATFFADPDDIAMQPADGASYATEIDGHTYVVIRNGYSTLAVYQVDGDRIDRLETWPSEIDQDAA